MRKAEEWQEKYDATLEEIQAAQEGQREFIEATNLAEMAKYRRGTERQGRAATANAEASAYLSGVSGGSGLSGYLSASAMDIGSALSEVTYQQDVVRISGAYDQLLSDLQFEADRQSTLVNKYGGWSQSYNTQAAQQKAAGFQSFLSGVGSAFSAGSSQNN
jgi:hypothetical protein